MELASTRHLLARRELFKPAEKGQKQVGKDDSSFTVSEEVI